jgi:cellulose synthase/poly-beta-1,6-N-acetylglucosamine synthase-like glycosyltransferase
MHRDKTAWSVLAVSAAIFLVGLWIIADGGFRRSVSLGVYLLINIVVLLDLIDVAVRLYLSHLRSTSQTSIELNVGTFTARQIELHLRPYAVVASVYNAEETLDDFLEAMQPVRDHLFVIDDCSTDQTALRLRRAGVKVMRGEVNRRKPGAIRSLLSAIPGEIETVVVVDPDALITSADDSNPRETLERVIFDFQRGGMAGLCPRLRIREDGWLARLQELEYALSFCVGRRSLADHTVTSGIAIYRRDALEAALRRHTLSVYAEDLRNALLMLGVGERIYYDARLVIQTEGKRSVAGWFSQRVGWFYGLLKVYRENFADVKRCARESRFLKYHYFIYLGVFSILLHPLKIIALALAALSITNAFDNLLGMNLIPDIGATDPLYFLLSYVKYTVLIAIVTCITTQGTERTRLLATAPIYYFYTLLHIIPITIGYLNWIALNLFGRRVYSDHYQDEMSVQKELAPV